MRKVLVITCFLVGCLMVLGAPMSHAGAILILDDPLTVSPIPDLIIPDGSTTLGLVDSSPQTGVITYVGSLGGFDISVSTGVTKPQTGSATNPVMHFNTIDTSAGAGNLLIAFSDDLYTPGNYADYIAYGGVAAGTMDLRVGVATAGVPADVFSTTVAGAFSGTSSGIFSIVNGTDRIYLSSFIHHTGAGTSSVNIDLTPVPEPGTMMLLGSGLVGLAGWGRKKFRK